MSTITRPVRDDRPRAVRSFLRARRAERRRPSAYHVYLVLLLAGIFGSLAWHQLSTLIGGSLAVHELLVYGPVALLLVSLVAARFGTWQGPVAFSIADVTFILSAPIAVGDVVRPKLDVGLAIGAALGAIAAGVALLLMAIGSAKLAPASSVCGVAGLACLGVLLTAASWLVESSRPAGRAVRRASPFVLLVAGALLWAASSGAAGRTVAVWSGPWGWAIAPLADVRGWPLALAAILFSTAAVAVCARRRAGAATAEQFVARAETRSGLTASAFSLDYRSAALTYRAARSVEAGRGARLRRPSRPRLVVIWRDALALIRDRSRVGWAVAIGAAGTLEVLSHPGRTVPAALSAAALYFAASLLCEPLRIDVDTPDTSAVLISWPFARLLVAHCVLPAAGLFAVSALTIAGATLAGVAAPAALALIPTVAVPVIATAVLCTALATLRGGRIDETILTRIASSDPSNPLGASVAVFWLAPWLIVELAVTGAAMLITGHAVAHHRPVVGPAVLAWSLSGACALVLLARARRAARPG
jgi:hypothetical protein